MPKPPTSLPILLAVLGILVLAGGMLVAWNQYQDKRRSDKIAVRDIANGRAPSTEQPSTSEHDQHQVPPDHPRYISIPKLKISARVKAVGLTADNKIQSPSNVHDVGWYDQSAKPNEPGAMVLDGHVSSWTTKGVFADLKKLVPGDIVRIEKGDGTTLTYEVVKIQVYSAENVDMNAAISPVMKGAKGLNLITCEGRVKKGTNEFDHRLVAFTKQI